MKRNTLLRASALLLVATLATSCFVGGTFAKYTTQGTGSATARVAKWGVTAEWTGNLFSKWYDDGKVNATTGSMMVVAPGTESPVPLELTISGQPEVSGTYTTTIDINLDGWEIKPDGEPLTDEEIEDADYDAETEFYCPLQFIINDTPNAAIDGSEFTSETDLVNEIKRQLSPLLTGDFDAGDPLDKSFKIEWAWPFNTSEANDKKDTYLGNKAAADRAPTIAINVTTTVEQVD